MPRRSAAQRPSEVPVTTAEIGTSDPIPVPVIEYLAALRSTDGPRASDVTERSSKRLKLTPEPHAPICVTRKKVSLSRKLPSGYDATATTSYEDAGQHLRFALDETGQLLITALPNASLGSFSVSLALEDGEADAELSPILEIVRSSSRRAQPGGAWMTSTLTLECRGGAACLTVLFELYWNETPSPYSALPSATERKVTRSLIEVLWPAAQEEAAWSPVHFYEAAHVPPKADTLDIAVPGLESKLFPYQQRTLSWLLSREGVAWSDDERNLRPIQPVTQATSPSRLSFRAVKDADGNNVFISDVFQTITRDTSPYEMSVKGGILAEEMGLGKTLEVLGLILLNRRKNQTLQEDGHSAAGLSPTDATLIVTPESLRQQWMTEIARHAPSLLVKHYRGCKKLQDGDDARIIEELCGYDVVITTYSVLSAELHFAREPPERSRRYQRVYRRTMSPLVKIAWWRLCLDEAQMIENGYSQAATVATVLPRINAWGITGTPVKDDVKDLFGLLRFLRYEPYTDPHIWQALLRHKGQFQQLFKSISLRHTKSLVRDEISLPAQKRYAISMPFTAVEEQYYQSLFKSMAEECGLEPDGSPKTDKWDPEDCEDTMRMWLNRLRQTALHPEVGAYGRRLLGYGKTRPMRTIDEVLAAMLEQSENAIRAEERAYLLGRLTRGQMYENSPRVKEGLAIWEDVRKETERLVADARTKLKDAIVEQGGEEALKNPERERKVHDAEDTDGDASDELDVRGNIGECRRRLRLALELHHRSVFFCANAYFQIKDNPEMTEPDSEEYQRLKKLEDDGYDAAKMLRREILQESNRRATRLMNRIRRRAATQDFVELSDLVTSKDRGIETGRILDNLDILYEELNRQAEVMDDWREDVIQLLLKPLVDEDDDAETTGEELGDSAKFQDVLMVYVTTLRATCADRQDAMSGHTNELAKHEAHVALKLAKAGTGPAPEKMIEMLTIKEKIRPKSSPTSMRGAVAEFRALQSRAPQDNLGNRAAMEAKIASDQMKVTQDLLNKENMAILALDGEIEFFKATMNARLEYYRQLQRVSDAVLPHEGPKTDEAIARLKQTEDELRRKLSSAEAKHRYLLNLKEAGAKSNEPRMCVICQTTFVTGVLTVCGHQFCKECMNLWFKIHRNCPVCKRDLKPSNLHDIAIKPQQLQIHSDGTGEAARATQRPASSSPGRSAIYSEFNAEKLAEIKNVELDGPSYTTKIDTLVRHLLWLRESDPGAKSIVFSQYKDFLHILRNAFRRFRIGHASVDDMHGITNFKENVGTEVFLLHARAYSSGLNLVNASHVFLCEPLLNTALELQAIARVDRIGQQHETTVWLYFVAGTVEESIYNLSVQRRMEHMGSSSSSRSSRTNAKRTASPELLDEANTLELEQAALSRLMSKDRTAGEMVAKGDLWECLFGHAKPNSGTGDNRVQERAVRSYLAGEAAEARR